MKVISGSLFPSDSLLPDGFEYHNEFISPQEETYLLETIGALELKPMNFQGFEAKRKVQSFGFDYSFDHRKLSKGKSIPLSFDPLVLKVAKELGVKASEFSELLVTEYPEGSVINWHRDAPPFEIIAGISLLSDCIFKLRPHDKLKQTRKTTLSFPVSRRSLYVIKDAARYDWQHSIAPVKSVRYSITLRTLKGLKIKQKATADDPALF